MTGGDTADRSRALIDVARSRRAQVAAVLAATVLVGAWHWQNDGLWFQGDAPRHAATGLFLWDLLTTLPGQPLDYALSYFARYPVLVLGAYPPLFHIAEALAFGLFGPSPWVARILVLACSGLAGVYVLLWGRRWIGPLAGWAGACTVLLPGFVRYSNVVLLNVPATALGLASLYHFQAWLAEDRARDRLAFVAYAVAAVLTYYPGGIVLPVSVAWLLLSTRLARGRFLLMLSGALVVGVVALAFAVPDHLLRHVPSLSVFTSAITWTFYGARVPAVVGLPWLALALVGAGTGLVSRVHRSATLRLVVALAGVVVCLALLPARDERYALLLGPVLVLTAFVAIVAVVDRSGRHQGLMATAVLAAVLTASVQAARGTHVPRVTGIDEAARYLRTNGPSDAVLYSGTYDGIFTFYVRAMDPRFERRVALSGRVLYQYRQAVDFTWVETPHVTTPDEVVSRVRALGCRWVAIEVGGDESLPMTERLLRRALDGPAFERVASFPVTARPVTRIDLYRINGPLEPAPPMDLMFPSFSSRVFRGVQPVTAGQ